MATATLCWLVNFIRSLSDREMISPTERDFQIIFQTATFRSVAASASALHLATKGRCDCECTSGDDCDLKNDDKATIRLEQVNRYEEESAE
jgi:hypothetical protein